MSRFAAIGAAMERAAREGAMEEVRNFHVNLYASKWQLLAEILFAFIPKTHECKRKLREKAEKILAAIRKYRPLIEEQYKLYHHYFYMWENNNFEGGYHNQEAASRGEDRALKEITRLTLELQAELEMIGWKYKPILTRNSLVPGCIGRIYIDNVFTYFAALEKHFADEVKSLSWSFRNL